MRKTLLIAGLAALALPASALAGPPIKVDRQNAAQTCAALRASMGAETFKQTYGTNVNRSNAFGRCVSRTTRAEHQNRHNAARACAAERAEIGVEAFRNKYGTNRNKRNAFGKCVSQQRREESREDRQAIVNAAKTCKAERETLGEEAFAAKYGTNENDRNAFGKCVSTLAKAQNQD